MKKDKEISQEERFDHLAEGVKAILSEGTTSAKLTALEAKHKAGEEIAKDALYKKWQKGSGDLMKKIAKRIRRSKSDIYFYVKMYEMFPRLEKLIMLLPGDKKNFRESDAKAIVMGKKIVKHQHEVVKVECWQCTICGQILRNKP